MARVLVVDDQPETVRLLEFTRQPPHQVVAAYDGQEALDIVTAQPPDVVLLDVGMPVLDGFRVLSRLRSDPKTARLPVIILTAYDQPEDIALGLTLGADYYVGKPFNPADIAALIGQSCGLPGAAAPQPDLFTT